MLCGIIWIERPWGTPTFLFFYNNNWAELIYFNAVFFFAAVHHRHPITHVCRVDGGANGLCHVRKNAWCLPPIYPFGGYWSMFNSPIMPESISRPIHNYHAGARQWWRVSEPTWLFKPIHSVWNPVKTHLSPCSLSLSHAFSIFSKATSVVIDRRGESWGSPAAQLRSLRLGPGPAAGEPGHLPAHHSGPETKLPATTL